MLLKKSLSFIAKNKGNTNISSSTTLQTIQKSTFAYRPKNPDGVAKMESPSYRLEGPPVMWDYKKANLIRGTELDPQEEPSKVNPKDYQPSTRDEKVKEFSDSERDVLRHYTVKEKKMGIIEPFEETFRRFASFCQSRTTVGLRSIDKSMYPKVSANAFVMSSATLVGNVEVHGQANIWYNCVIKGQTNKITIGGNTNVQDGTVILESPVRLGLDHDGSTVIGNWVTIGHNCVLHAVTIEDFCFVGMGSVMEDDTYMEQMSMLGAGSVLKKGSRVGEGQLWVGNPAVYVRDLTGKEIKENYLGAYEYRVLAQEHLSGEDGIHGTVNPITRYSINV